MPAAPPARAVACAHPPERPHFPHTLISDLVRQVRAAKTAAEERAVVAAEAAKLREAFREQVRKEG